MEPPRAKALLIKKRNSPRLRDQLSAERRALPLGEKWKSNMCFDAPEGRLTLADLFDGRSQLLVKHFHVRTRLQEGLCRVLVRGGSCRWRPGASRAP